MIRCSDNSLYTGITTDVIRRFNEHAAQGPKAAKYLRGKAPLELVWTVETEDRVAASQLEHTIKKMSKAEKEQLIVE